MSIVDGGAFVLRNQELVDYFDAMQPKVCDLMKSKPLVVTDMDGKEQEFLLHRIPALWCQAIVDAFIHSSIPKMASPFEKEAVTKAILRFVTVELAGEQVNMDSSPAMQEHMLGFGTDTLSAIINGMIQHNSNFFPDGVPSVYEMVMQKVTESLLHAVGETISVS